MDLDNEDQNYKRNLELNRQRRREQRKMEELQKSNPLAETGKRLFSNVDSAFRKRKRDTKRRNRRMWAWGDSQNPDEDLWGNSKIEVTIQDQDGSGNEV